jgi:hypothetical protein
MPSKSIAMPATLRVSRTREPLALTPISSPMLEPLKSRTSVPPWPSTVSPSPGSPPEAVVAGAELRGVGADVAVDEVVPGPADERVIAVGAGEAVVAGTTVDRQVAEPRDAVAAADHVVAGAGLHVDRGERAGVEAEGERAVHAHRKRVWSTA